MTPRLCPSPTRLFGGFSVLGAMATLTRAAGAKSFDPVAATEALLNTLPADQRARSDAYFEGGYWLPVWDLLITALFTWLVLRLGVVQRLRDWAMAEKTTRRLLMALIFPVTAAVAWKTLKLIPGPDWLWMVRLVAGTVAAGLVTFVFLKPRIAAWSRRPGPQLYLAGIYFLALFTTLSWIVTLPWGLYIGYYREHAYGLSNLSLAGWFGESLKGQVIFTLIFSLLGPLLCLGIREYPRGWWVAGGVVTPFLLIFFAVISPVFIAPVFNDYQPLADATVRDPILSMARANSVPADNVYQFDASKQTTRISANVSGALGTIRVSLNDNLLKRCSPAEVQAVMAHELGHYVLNHIYKFVVNFSLLVIIGLAFTHWFGSACCRRFGAQWRLQGLGDLASLPLLWLGVSLFMFFATPVQNSLIRTQEVEADLFGLNAARQPDGFAGAALKLADYRKLSPGPWEERLLFDHPSGRSRILMAMRWKAEHLAELEPR